MDRITDIWPTLHAERAALAADRAGLTDARWATPSLCAGYSVRDVLAHLTAAASLGPVRWMWSGVHQGGVRQALQVRGVA